MPTAEPDDDDVLTQVVGIGATLKVALDPTVDPQLRAMAQHAADKAAADLNRENT